MGHKLPRKTYQLYNIGGSRPLGETSAVSSKKAFQNFKARYRNGEDFNGVINKMTRIEDVRILEKRA
jgi:hypothetical protein